MSARREASDPRRALLASVEAADVDKVRSLLEAGAHPLAEFKNKTPVIEAMFSGNEEVMRLFVERIRRIPGNTFLLNSIACNVFSRDQYSVAFAAELAADVDVDVPEFVGSSRHLWAAILTCDGASPHTNDPPIGARVPDRLAGKVRLAVELGWEPATAWDDGWLPHHGYLSEGFVEAAVACVEAGANPNEPMRRRGLESPETLAAWPAFQAALRAKKALDIPTEFTSTRVRHRP